MQLNKHFDSEFTKLLENYNGFFAFSNKQFDEAKKEWYKYVSLDGWLLIWRPTDWDITGQEYANKFYEELEAVTKESARIDLEAFGLERIIKYELDNHETSYTGDIEPAYNALEKYGATLEQVSQVFKWKSLDPK